MRNTHEPSVMHLGLGSMDLKQLGGDQPIGFSKPVISHENQWIIFHDSDDSATFLHTRSLLQPYAMEG